MIKNIFLLMFSIFIIGTSNLYAEGEEYNLELSSGLQIACQNVINEADGKTFDGVGFGMCLGFFRGIKESYDMQRMANNNKRGNICTQSSTTWMDIIISFMKWIENHPEMLNKSAWTGAIKSMSTTYPCK